MVLVFLLTYGAVPLLIGALANIRQNRTLVETQEQINLTHRVEALTGELAGDIDGARERLQQLGETLTSIPRSGLAQSTRREWLDEQLLAFTARSPELLFARVALAEDGREFAPGAVPPDIEDRMATAIDRALASGEGSVDFLEIESDRTPAAIVTEVTLRAGGSEPTVSLSALVPLRIRPEGETTAFLVDTEGELLWSENPDEQYQQALRESTLVADFARHPSVFVSEYSLTGAQVEQRWIAQVSPIGDLGWGLVVQQPKAAAFGAARKLVNSTLVSALLMLVLALVFAVAASQLISRPIQRLAETSKEIAAGSFQGRVIESGFSREITDLAQSFNVMSGHVGESMERLRRAAVENHELFLGSIRAMLTAIEAKEPYTRGHSERVAAFSQAIARHLGTDAEFQEQIWVAGLLHDVGKLGIDDRILKKGNALTEEEFEEIKRHPIVGEEIIAPIEQLAYSLPAIRWHHEKWNGRGYPDGLRREAIPLMARIVAIADSFDAMTTQRIYQEAMSSQEAVAWIRQQNGVLFDSRVVEGFLSAYQKEEIKAAGPEAPPLQPVPLPVPAVGESVYT
jgi:HD-GYP domain-containing protein (c-di-GMP phosphodiesterase class II)